MFQRPLSSASRSWPSSTFSSCQSQHQQLQLFSTASPLGGFLQLIENVASAADCLQGFQARGLCLGMARHVLQQKFGSTSGTPHRFSILNHAWQVGGRLDQTPAGALRHGQSGLLHGVAGPSTPSASNQASYLVKLSGLRMRFY